MKMTVERTDATLTLILGGDIDATVAYQPYEEAVAAFDVPPPVSRVVLDLADVSFADSTALGTLVRIRELTAEHDAACLLRGTPERLMTLLTMTGLAQTFEFA